MHHLLRDGHQPPVLDGILDLIVKGNGVINLPQRLLIGAIRGRRDAQDAQVRVGLVPIQHTAVTGARAVVSLIHHHNAEQARVEPVHPPPAVAARGLRLDGGYHHPGPAEHAGHFSPCLSHLHIHAPAGHGMDTVTRLKDQLLTVGQDQGPAREGAPDDL